MSQRPESFILLIAKGILRDRVVRRAALFWIVAAALALLGVGALLLDRWLMEHLLFFLLYWGVCLWLTLTALLLALYDMLALGAEARRERRKLKSDVFETEIEEKP